MCIRIAGDVSCHDSYGFPSGQPFYPADTTLGAPTTWGAIPQTVALAAAINNESKPCVHTVAAAASVLPADVYGPRARSVWVVVQAHEILLQSPLAAHMPSPRQIRLQAYAGDPRNAARHRPSISHPSTSTSRYISPVYIVCRNSQRSDGRDLLRICEPEGAQTGALLATASWTGACGTGLLGDASVC